MQDVCHLSKNEGTEFQKMFSLQKKLKFINSPDIWRAGLTYQNQ